MQSHCMKNVQIWSFFCPAFSRIWTEYGEIRGIYGPERTPYLVTFHAVSGILSPSSIKDRAFCDNSSRLVNSFFSIWIFHKHLRFTVEQGKREVISLTPLYHFHPLHRHFDISRQITAESSPLHKASSQARTGSLWFPSASH